MMHVCMWGDILIIVGDVQYHGDIMINVGDILSTMGGYHEYRGGILSTMGDTQYRGGYYDARGLNSFLNSLPNLLKDTLAFRVITLIKKTSMRSTNL